MDYTAWSMAYWEEASRVQERMAQVRQEGLPPSPRRRRCKGGGFPSYMRCTWTASTPPRTWAAGPSARRRCKCPGMC